MPLIAVITLNGRALSDEMWDSLAWVSVERSVGSVGAAHIRFRDGDVVSSSLKVGAEIRIGMSDEQARVDDVFEGVVTSLAVDLGPTGAELLVGALDGAHRLGARTKIAAHLDVTVADLITAIGKDAGLAVEVDSSLRSPVLPFVQQTGTPHQFLDRLAAARGCEWFVKENSLVVRRRKQDQRVEVGGDGVPLRKFSARFTGIDDASEVSVRGWDPTRKEVITADATGTRTRQVGSVPVVARNDDQLGVGTATAIPAPLSSVSAASASAEAAIDRLEASALTGRGEVDGNPFIAPGTVLVVDGVGDDWNGDYYVTGVEHVFGDRQPLITRFTLGALGPTSLVDLFAPTVGCSTDRSAARLASNLTIGIVTNVEDPDEMCRVKLRLPYLDDEGETDWARLALPGAGAERGSVVVPEVNDEVIVGFENGDLQRPVVLGGLWNGKDRPPIERVGAKGKISSRSMTSRNGHEVFLSDGDAAKDEFVALTVGDGKRKDPQSAATKVLVGQTRIEVHGDKVPIEIVTGNATITLGDDNSVKIAGGNISLDASGSLKLSAKSGVEISTNGALSLDGASVDVKAKAKVGIDGGAMAEMKAGMVKIN